MPKITFTIEIEQDGWDGHVKQVTSNLEGENTIVPSLFTLFCSMEILERAIEMHNGNVLCGCIEEAYMDAIDIVEGLQEEKQSEKNKNAMLHKANFDFLQKQGITRSTPKPKPRKKK